MNYCLICGQTATGEARLKKHMEGKIRHKAEHHPNYGGHEISSEEVIKLISEAQPLKATIENGYSEILERITLENKNVIVIRIITKKTLDNKLISLYDSQNRFSKYSFEMHATEENDPIFFYEWILREPIPLVEAINRGYVSLKKEQ